MLLAIDIGNTRIKVAVFEQDTILAVDFPEVASGERTLEELLKKYPDIAAAVVSSVGNKPDWLQKTGLEIMEIDRNTRFPFKNRYRTPETLGIDRMVLAAGAVLKYPGLNRLVIDAGTCITYDFINKDNEYLGGAISPGIRLRYRAMNDYTSKLPLLSPQVPPAAIGDATESSMHSGVVGGVAHEIDGFISTYGAAGDNFIIILTGGDAEFLAAQLKNTIFASSNFLLESLNALYQYNHE